MPLRDVVVSTAFALVAVAVLHVGSDAFVGGIGRPTSSPGVAQRSPAAVPLQPAAAAEGSIGVSGLVGFGMCFGLAFAAVGRTVTRVSRRAEGKEIAVAEKGETKPAKYLENIPRTLVDKKLLDTILARTPKEQWDDPPEESTLYAFKVLSETYGPGKATKMRYSDFAYLKNQLLPSDEDEVIDDLWDYRNNKEFMKTMTGKIPLQIPGPSGWWSAGVDLQWKGPEPFAGDQVQILVRDSGFSKQFLDNLAFYRQGLKPWQRGFEIGLAHGYFIIGPFVSLGPLRNTPEAATIGLLAGVATIYAATIGGLILGTTVKPTIFDKPGQQPGEGYQEMIRWHAIGGTGGAAFAHILLTLFAL